MYNRLKAFRESIKIAIIGTGSMGKGLYYQSLITPGMECVAVADIKVERCVACLEQFGRNYQIVRDLQELHEVIRRGRVAVCEDGELLARCDFVDVLIEASNSIGPAGRFAVTALEHHKHLVMMNAEADLIFGPYLNRLAHENEVTYSSCDGDQYGVLKHMIDEIQFWGFELVMAGNIKGFLDRYSNPTKIIPEADKRNLDYKMATAYTDGTKLCIEMAITANSLNLRTAVPGMLGYPAKHVSEALTLFDFPTLWQDKQPVVDYILGAEPGGGVFAVGYCNNDYQREMLAYYKMGQGPFYLFYRPYHLCHLEALQTVAEAALDKHPLMQPTYGFQTNVYAYAKKDMWKGESLDGIGGYTCYGLIENCSDNVESPGLPICLAEDVTLRRAVAKDEKILVADVDHDPNSIKFQLFHKAQEQSRLLAGG